MTKVIDINDDRFICESCEGWFDYEHLFRHDEDGNQFCNNCCKDAEEEIVATWTPVNED